MEFEEFLLNKMAESMPETLRHRSVNSANGSSHDEPWSDLSGFEWMNVTDVDLGEAGVQERLSRSLDLGHDSLPESQPTTLDKSMIWGSAGKSGSFACNSMSPWQCSTDSYGVCERTESDQLGEIEDTGEDFKSKLMSAWNSVRYGWNFRLKTNFRYDSPIWLLGKCYRCTRAEKEQQKKNTVNGIKTLTNFDLFKKDFTSMLWFTYRREFPAFAGSQLKTDTGWGCMLRSGQMLLAQALVLHFLGREWPRYSHQRQRELYHHQIIHFFGDLPHSDCPFSIHHLVDIGREHGKQPGDWYGPASVAYVLRDAMERCPKPNPMLRQLCVYVAQDCTVYKQDVRDLCIQWSAGASKQGLCTAGGSTSVDHWQSSAEPAGLEEHWRAIIILIPVRLGGEHLNPVYIPCVQKMLEHPLCLGIIGGKPKHSVYFVGWQEDKLIYLDPHIAQDVVNVQQREFPTQSYHCSSPQKMAITKMDPSCTLGFYCKNRADFEQFIAGAEQFASPPKEKGLYPLFVFVEGRSIDLVSHAEVQASKKEKYLRVRHVDKKGRVKHPSRESDDFVFL